MSQGQITEQGAYYRLDFSYRPNVIDAVRKLPGRKWDFQEKTWMVPREYQKELQAFARRYGFTFAGDMRPEQEQEIPAMPELTIDLPGIKRQLFPFQKQGVAFILEKKKVIVGDQPGLGKTTQAFAAILAAPEARPCLIICPATLRENWKREIEQHTTSKAIILTDTIKNTLPLYAESGLADFFIVNFESLKKYFVESIDPVSKRNLRLQHIHFKTRAIGAFKSVIIDESHRVKSTGTMQTKLTKGICIGKEWILALTGTPVVNKPKDLIAQLGIIDQLGPFGGYKNFTARYCAGQREASNLRELNAKLRGSCFYRREKTEVLKDLPAKTRQIILSEIKTRKEYAEAEADLENYLRMWKEATDEQIAKSMRGEVMVRIGVLKNISARGKLKEVVEFVDDLVEQGEKVVIFCHLHEVITQIKSHYPQAVSVTGMDGQKERQQAIDSFQTNPKVKIIVCGIQAAGVGITLTASSQVAFVELGWHPAIHDQCEDRCHRIGQNDNVTCTYFLGKDTIDEWVYKIIDEKRQITSAATGASDDIEENVIDRVWNLFNQKKEK